MTVQFERLSDHAGDELRLTKERYLEAQWNAQVCGAQAAHADAHYREVRRARPRWKRMFGVATSEMRDAEQRRTDAQRQSGVASGQHIVGPDVREQVATLIRKDHSYHDRKMRERAQR